MVFVKEAHDVGLVRTDGTTVVGLMLARDKYGLPMYEERNEPYLAAQYVTGVPGYSGLPPERELALRQDNWNSGFGQLFFDNESRYYYTINGDGRFKNQFLLGPTSTAIAAPSYPSAPTITNADMELTTGWTGGGRSAAQAHAGTYSWLVDANGGTESTGVQSMSTYIKGGTYTFTCWAHGDAAGATLKIGISDGVSTSYSSNYTAATWGQISVTKHISIAATQLQLILSTTSGGGANNGWFDDAAITITSQTVGASKIAIDYNSVNYRAFGRYLVKLNGTGNGWTQVADCRAPITSMESFDDGFLYIACEDDTVIEDCEDAWNELVDGDVTASLDTGDYKVGSGSAKFVCAANLGAGDIIATEAISSTDISMKTGIALWIKSTVALSSGDLQLLLDNTASCATPLETINIPAVSANTWTRVYLKLAAASSDTAIISIGLKQVVDKGAMTVWVDDVKTAVSYYYMGAGEVFTQSTLATEASFAKFFKRKGTTLYKALSPNRLFYATDPTNNGSWSAVITVDSTLNEITGLAVNSLLHIGKEDQVFYLDTSLAVQQRAAHLVALRSSTSGKNILSWKDWIFSPCGDQSLFRYDVPNDTSDFVSPASYITDSADFDGAVQALAGDAEFLFAAIDNATAIEIVAGKHDADLGKWVWHSLCEITLTGAEHMMASSVYARRLWISSTSSSDSVYWIPLSSMYGNLSDDTSYSFKTGGYLVTSWLHANFKDSDKAYLNVTLFSEDCTANIYWSVSYEKYGDSSWTALATNFTTSPSQTVAIPNDGSGNKPVSEYFRLKITGTTNDTTKTPKLTGYRVDAILYAARRRIITCVVSVADDWLNKQGMKETVQAKDILAALDEASLTATYPQTFYDLMGTARTVTVLPETRVRPVKLEKGRNPEYEYTLVMRRIS